MSHRIESFKISCMDLYLPLKIMIYAHSLFHTKPLQDTPNVYCYICIPQFLRKSKTSIKSTEMQYICLIMHKYIHIWILAWKIHLQTDLQKALNILKVSFMTPTRVAVMRESRKRFYHFYPGKKSYFTYCKAIKSKAVLKQISLPYDSMLLKQQVLLIHLGLNTLIPRSKFH